MTVEPGLISIAREAARRTPASRNRAADTYRVVAISFVVLGHWTLVAPYISGAGLELRNILAEQPWTQYLTWLFQVMPVFFFVGGFSNAASWSSAQNSTEGRSVWAIMRLRRLLLPVMPLVFLWALAAAVAHVLGVDPNLASAAAGAALIPLWFLAVYIMVTLAVPISYAAWRRFGLRSVAVLAVLAILCDFIGIGLGQSWLRWANYAAVWLAIHQLGFWWWRGNCRTRDLMILIGGGCLSLWVLMVPADYPLSMVSVPGEPFSNSRPPTTAMLALGSVQIGLLLLLEKPVASLMRRESPWLLVIVAGQSIMTVYLWHLTVVIAIIGLSIALGGIGLRTEPGTGLWWLLRPAWIAVLAASLLPFIAALGRFERSARSEDIHGSRTALVGVGALFACAGLTLIALEGISIANFPGFNWGPALLTITGIALATRE